jgi:hypothetical protein
MTIIQSLYNHFESCPILDGRAINVDYLPENAKRGVEFSIEATPGTQELKRYMDGGADCQYTFVLRSVNAYGPDVWQNITNGGFYEELCDWMRRTNRNGTLPLLDSGMIAERIEPLSTAYLFSEGADTGKYQIQCRLLYSRDGDR